MSSSSSQTSPFFRKMPHLAERASKQHRHTHSSSTLNIVMMCVQKNLWINTHRHTSWMWQRVLYNPSSHLKLVFVPVCLPDVLRLQILDSCCVALKQKINQNADLSSPLLLTAAQFNCLFFSPLSHPNEHQMRMARLTEGGQKYMCVVNLRSKNHLLLTSSFKDESWEIDWG